MSSLGYKVIAVVVATVAFVVLAYVRGWRWTGFVGSPAGGDSDAVRPAKTLWDWLQLLLIPLALSAVVFVFNELQTDREHDREDRRAAAERLRVGESAREEVLRAYWQQMSRLMLDRRLLSSPKGSEVRAVARVTTLSALRRLDGERKGMIVRFLAEADLISGRDPKVSLREADLRYVVLEGASLRGTRLSMSHLVHANFRRAFLSGANFSRADLRGADFSGAHATPPSPTWMRDWITAPPHGFPTRSRPLNAAQHGATFQGANLTGARFTEVGFDEVNFRFAMLEGTQFRSANLYRTDFGVSCLTGADFRNARLWDSQLEADGREVDFSGVEARDARRYGTAVRRKLAYGPLRRAPTGWRRTGLRWSRGQWSCHRAVGPGVLANTGRRP